MKRAYRAVSLSSGPEGLQLLLDGKPALTPGKRSLALPSPALAEAVAAEWRTQGDRVEPETMPLTQLACTTIDLTLANEAAVHRSLAAYGATDLLCYRADRPATLVARQRQSWQPLLDWAEARFAAPLTVTEGLMAVTQPPASLAALAAAVGALRGFRLTALAQLVQATGSLVIGLAVAHSRIDAAEAFAAAELDESWQLETWGEDPVALQRRRKLAADIEAAARLLALVRSH
ncbi:MAG TPA: ATP12 family protein [Kiloniellales bacterium]|nr:ATP12 family protein [Kiloniellales bacterium]